MHPRILERGAIPFQRQVWMHPVKQLVCIYSSSRKKQQAEGMQRSLTSAKFSLQNVSLSRRCALWSLAFDEPNYSHHLVVATPAPLHFKLTRRRRIMLHCATSFQVVFICSWIWIDDVLFLERALQCVTNIPQMKIIQDVQHGGWKIKADVSC